MKNVEQNFCHNVQLTEGTEICVHSDIFNITVKQSETDDLVISGSFKCQSGNMTGNVEGKLDHLKEKRYIGYSINETDIREYFDFDNIFNPILTIEVPQIAFSQGYLLDIETLNSNITVQSITGKFNLKSVEGNIRIEQSGQGTIFTTNGDVKLFEVINDLKVNTVNGDVKLKGGVGTNIDITSENGDIKVTDSNFDVISCKTNNGDIFTEVVFENHNLIDLSSVNGDIVYKIDNDLCKLTQLNTSNGDIKISIPDEVQINLDVSTLHGDIKNQIENDGAVEINSSETQYNVFYGEDLPYIKAQTIHGDIKITKDENVFYRILDKELKKAEDLLQELSNSQTVENAKEIIDSVYQSLNNTMSKLKNKVSGEEAQKYQDRIATLIEQIKSQVTKDNIEDIFDKAKNIITDVAEKISPLSKHLKEKAFNVYSNSEEKPSKWNKIFDKDKDNIAVMKILDLLDKKTITTEEAEKLIKVLRNK
jgi:DUF4097 and DUF4098 domain-containing protein YvlB